MAEPNAYVNAEDPYLRAVQASYVDDWEAAVEALGPKTTYELAVFAERIMALHVLILEMIVKKHESGVRDVRTG
jgi:hypothetical protein